MPRVTRTTQNVALDREIDNLYRELEALKKSNIINPEPQIVEGGQLSLLPSFGVSENGTAVTYEAENLNFIDGTNAEVTVANNTTNNRVDITLAAKSQVRRNSTGSNYTRSRLNFIEGTDVTLSVADDAGNDEIDITINSTGGGGGGGDSTTTAAYASRPAVSNDGNLFFPSDGFHVHRDTSAVWEQWGFLSKMYEPDDSAFSWTNQGGASVSVAGGGIYLLAPATAGESYRIREYTAPATPYVITACFIPNALAVTFHMYGLCWRETGTGEVQSGTITQTTTSLLAEIRNMNSPTSFNAAVSSVAVHPVYPPWLRISDDGADRKFDISRDGQNWRNIWTATRTTFLTPDRVGFFAQPLTAGSDMGVTLISWRQT